jgi:hypothetical protein
MTADGQHIDIRDLNISELAQSVQLPCWCTVTCFAASADGSDRAHVKLTGVSTTCNEHAFEQIGSTFWIDGHTPVWAALDAPKWPRGLIERLLARIAGLKWCSFASVASRDRTQLSALVISSARTSPTVDNINDNAEDEVGYPTCLRMESGLYCRSSPPPHAWTRRTGGREAVALDGSRGRVDCSSLARRRFG